MSLRLRGLCKSYGATEALRGVDLDLEEGEILALCGENGAGKSTLVRILSGVESPDRGRMELRGGVFSPRSPAKARLQGVSTLHQELSLVKHLTVEQNLVLGLEPGRLGVIDMPASRARAEQALAKAGASDVDPGTVVAELSVGVQQRVEIARALLGGSTLLILDEPTARLSRPEAESLFALLRKLRDGGLPILYISHFLDEVKNLADRVCVLRDGSMVGGGQAKNLGVEDLIGLMLGRKISEIFPPRRPLPEGGAILEIERLRGPVLPLDASLTLGRGELLGIAGLTGSGRTEFLRCVYGLDPVLSGRLLLRGKEVRGGAARSIKNGIGFLSEDRKDEGLALSMSVAENITLSSLGKLAWPGLLKPGERAEAEISAKRIDIRFKSLDQEAQTLSGGNQQKLALARLGCQGAEVLLLDQPTRGVDIGSRARIYAWLDALLREGKSVLMASDDSSELLGLADRVAVMRGGVLGPALPSDRFDPLTLHAAIQAGAKAA